MVVSIVEGQKPYSAGTGIDIDSNKVISLLLREENNLINVNDNNEIYTDLQLVNNIRPTDDFPVGVCVGSVTVNDGWYKSGLMLNYKTTSGDYGRWLYASGYLYYDGGNGTFKEVYFASKVDQLFSELAAVAHTGDYNDLINKPEFLQVQADWNQEDNTKADYIKNKPEIISAKDGQLTIKRNGTTVGQFTANQETNTDVNISVPSVVNNTSSTSSTNALSANMGKELSDRIDEIELTKVPNASIVGEPTIESGNISGFSANDYLIVPYLSGFAPYPFTLHMDIVTGADVTTQQNIIDSDFGLAFAIKNGHFVIALSSTGTSWDLGEHTGTYTVEANTYYCVEMTWTGSAYALRYSLNKLDFLNDISVTSEAALSGTPLYLGGYGPNGTHAFGGTFNFNEWQFTSMNTVVWKGMDSAGLNTRANLSLSNLNSFGEAKLNALRGIYTLKEGEDYTAVANTTRSTAPRSTSYGSIDITITNSDIKQELGRLYQFIITDTPGTTTYRNIRVRFGEDGEWLGLGGLASVSAQYSYFVKTKSCLFALMPSTGSAMTNPFFQAKDTDTTYSTMTVAEATAGTSTSARTITPKILNDKISAMLPDTTGFITKDVDNLTNYTKTTDLSTVATSGSYNDLSNKPTIPTVNNSTITIKQGGTQKGTFTLNQGSGSTIELDAGGSDSVKIYDMPSEGGSLSDCLSWMIGGGSVAFKKTDNSYHYISKWNASDKYMTTKCIIGTTLYSTTIIYDASGVVTTVSESTTDLSSGGGISSSTVSNIWTGTETEYNAITTKSASTLYFVKE